MVSHYLLDGSSDEEAIRESPEDSNNEQATRESPEGCSTEEATLEFNEDTKSPEEKSHHPQDDDKSNQEEIRNPGEGTSKEEPHPEHPPQSAGILNRRESRSGPENVAGPSNRRCTVDSLTGSSDQEKIMVPNTPASGINENEHTNDKSEDLLGFGNKSCSKLEDLNSTHPNENSRDSQQAGPSNRNDNDNQNSQDVNAEAFNTVGEDTDEDTRDTSQDFFYTKSNPPPQKTSSDDPEKSDQESVLEQPPHTHSNSENRTESNDSDDNVVRRCWNESITFSAASSERDDNGDQPRRPHHRIVGSTFQMRYEENSEEELEIESFSQPDILEVKNFVNIFRKSDYDITNPKTPEHPLTPYIRSTASSNAAPDASTSQESLDETAATTKRDTDKRPPNPPNPEVLGTPATSIISETPQTLEASVSLEPSDTLENSETITPEPLETPKSPGSSDHSDRDNINFQESSNKIINNAEDDNTSQENLDERTTTTGRDDDIDQLGSSESPEEPYPLLTPCKRKLRSRSNKVFGPSDYSDNHSIDIQENNNEMINVTQKDDDRVLPRTSKAYKDSYQFKSKTSPLKRRMVARVRSLQESSNDTINEANDDSTNQENINEIATTRERNNDDSDQCQSVLTQLELDLKRTINDNPGLCSGLDNVADPSGHSDYDNNNFLPSSNTEISVAQDDNIGKKKINKRATIRKKDIVNNNRPTTTSESSDGHIVSPRKRKILDSSGLRSTSDDVPGPSDSDESDLNEDNIMSRAVLVKCDDSYEPEASKYYAPRLNDSTSSSSSSSTSSSSF